jgi:hypothetical protein
MSKEFYRSQIEIYKRFIESGKAKIADCREEIAEVKIRKRRETEDYARQLKDANSSAQKQNIRASKARQWESFAREIDREKDKIESYKKDIERYRDLIASSRESLKRAR